MAIGNLSTVGHVAFQQSSKSPYNAPVSTWCFGKEGDVENFTILAKPLCLILHPNYSFALMMPGCESLALSRALIPSARREIDT